MTTRCLECSDREQTGAFGLCDVCRDDRRERVRASLGAGDDGDDAGSIDVAAAREQLDEVDREPEPDDELEEREASGQLSLDAF